MRGSRAAGGAGAAAPPRPRSRPNPALTLLHHGATVRRVLSERFTFQRRFFVFTLRLDSNQRKVGYAKYSTATFSRSKPSCDRRPTPTPCTHLRHPPLATSTSRIPGHTCPPLPSAPLLSVSRDRSSRTPPSLSIVASSIWLGPATVHVPPLTASPLSLSPSTGQCASAPLPRMAHLGKQCARACTLTRDPHGPRILLLSTV